LVVFSDLTSMLEAKRAEARQQEILQIFDRIMANKAGFLEFWEEAERLIQTLSAEGSDPVTSKRVLHTLKGNCGIFGLSSIAELCHELENRLVEGGALPTDTDLQELDRRWQELKRSLDRFIGNRKGRIEIDDVEYESILTELIAGAPREELAERIASWRFEPIERRLETLADQAKGLAKRLGKGTIDIALEAPQSLRMEPEHWRGFWAAFVHVLRNAVDHGLESRVERSAAGKSEKGQIQLRSWVADNEFHIALADDGRGIDWERVQEIARSQGLPDDNTRDLMNALFADGVSTKTTVTELSGRGVGLSAVKEAAEAREGRVQIASEPGRGTELRFSFPIHQLAPSTQRP
jgi:chemotaxis protein histidine kinase CheA